MINKSIKKIFAPVMLVFVLVGIGFAQSEQVTEFDVNGLKVLVKRRPNSPTVAAALFIRGGSRNIDDKNAGVEDLMLRSAIEAGKKYPRQTVRREFARTGSAIAAGAGEDFSAVSLAATRPNFDRMWDIFTDVVMSPVFAPDDIERNRRITLSALRESEVSPEGALQAEIDRVIYAGHPYANNVNGTPETVIRFTAADLAAYHNKMMRTSRLLLVFVGDLNPEELKAKIMTSFGKLPRGDYKETDLPPLNFTKPTLDIVARPNIPTNYVKGVFDAPSLKNPEYYPMQVMISILQQLVYQEVRVNRQLSYAPAAEVDKFAASTANISVSSTDANTSVRLMLEQAANLRTQILNDDVVSDVAGNFLTTYYLGQETSAAQVAELARYELIGGGWRNSLEFLDRIRKVKSGEVQSVANKYIKNIRFVVVGNPSAIDRSIFLQ